MIMRSEGVGLASLACNSRSSNKPVHVVSMTMYDYIRTSRDQARDWPGMNPDTQGRNLLAAAVPNRNIHADIDVSSVAGVATCNPWMSVDARRGHGDALVVALDRIGRRSFDVMGKDYDLVNRGDRVRPGRRPAYQLTCSET